MYKIKNFLTIIQKNQINYIRLINNIEYIRLLFIENHNDNSLP